MVPNNAELRAWIEQGRIAGEDELSPDGQQWTLFSTLNDLELFISQAPPPRARRNSQMSMPAVRLNEDAVKTPSINTLGSIPPAPRVPSMGNTSVPPPPGHRPSVPPPAHTSATPTGAFTAPGTPRPPSLSPLAPSRTTGSFPAYQAPAQPAASTPVPANALFGATTVAASSTTSATAATFSGRSPSIRPPGATSVPPPPSNDSVPPQRVTQRGLPVSQALASSAAAVTPSKAPSSLDKPLATATASTPPGPSLTAEIKTAPSVPPPTAQPTVSATPTTTPSITPSAAPPSKSKDPLSDTGIRKSTPALFGSSETTSDSISIPAPSPSKRAGMSIPPIASVVVSGIDSETVERSSNRTTDRLPLAPAAQPASVRNRLTMALSGLALITSTVAIVQSARNATKTTTAITATQLSSTSEGTRASLDQQIEQLSALIASQSTSATQSDQQHSLASLQTQRARFLAMRAEHSRGISSDLEFLSQNKSDDEAILLRAEARVLNRQAAVDGARAMMDARASAATVPPADAVGQWAWSHALVHAVNGDRDGAATYLERARTSGANTGYVEGITAREQGQWVQALAAFDRASESAENVEFSLLAAARTARAQGQTAVAQRHAQRVLQMHSTHDSALSVLQSIGAEPSAPTVSPTPSVGDAGALSEATPAPSGVSDAGSAADQYSALVAEGQRWMRRGEYPKARTAYRQALAVRADGTEARSGEAWVNLRMGSYQASYAAFRELFAANRREFEFRAGVGLSLEKLQRNDEAIRELRSYLAVAPWGLHSDEVRRRLAVLTGSTANR